MRRLTPVETATRGDVAHPDAPAFRLLRGSVWARSTSRTANRRDVLLLLGFNLPDVDPFAGLPAGVADLGD